MKRQETPQPDTFVKWIQRLKRSDQQAMSDLFEAMHTPLLRYAFHQTGNAESARDIVQDTFRKVWEKRETLDETKSLKGYMYTAVRNASLNLKRRGYHSGDGLESLTDRSATVEDELHAATLARHLNRFIDELPEKRRLVFKLSRFEGLTHKEIADRLEVSPRTINTHVSLALRYLRRRMGELN